MRILVIGGTRFVGRNIVISAFSRGHEVSMFHRGDRDDEGGRIFPAADHRHGDRNIELSALAGGNWDATIDVSAYLPGQVDSLAAALDGRGGRHVFVSTVSVYDTPPGPGLREDSRLVELPDPTVTDVTDATYGGLKVLCERRAREHYGSGLLIIRPTYVIGPHDYTWRLPYWLGRIAAGGDILVPGPPDSPMQVIDARDQARFVLDLVERSVPGTFHTASPAPPFSLADLLGTAVATIGGPGSRLVWGDPETLLAAGADDTAFPFWDGRPDDTLAVDPSAALAAGLAPRPLADSIRDTWAWMTEPGVRPDPRLGLSHDRERELIRASVGSDSPTGRA
jgi:2'-hydroxyisoflavone reductase